jgi:general secretion pathway protein G
MKLAVSSWQLAEKSRERDVRSSLPAVRYSLFTRSRGFSLLELVITLTVLSILTLGVMPLVQLSVRRQREQRLREALREMRLAIREFHQDTIGSPCTGTPTANATSDTRVAAGIPGDTRNPNQQQAPVDPRSRVVISDCKIFTVDNPDRYPPDLDTLVNGVSVSPRGGGGAGPLIKETATSGPTATEINSSSATSTKKKIYLRSIPVDPITGEAEWELRSCYDEPDATSWGKENVFDVRSKAEGTALNGEKYRDW